MKNGKYLKPMFFLLITFVILGQVMGIVCNGGDAQNYKRIMGLYDEPEGSLDAVYIGASVAYSYWIPPLAWEHYGIAVTPFASRGQIFAATEYMIREARKTQPDALYIISINPITAANYDYVHMHWSTDYLPFSYNKFCLIKRLSDLGGYNLRDRMEFYIPLIRYHSRWNELEAADFGHSLDGMKGGSTYRSFLGVSTDVSDSNRFTKKRKDLSDTQTEILTSLLNYIEQENVSVLFVTSPQAVSNEADLATYNTVNDLLEERGFSVLAIDADKIGLSFTTDFYNANHVNIHGGIKATNFLANYLVDHYNFHDHRGDPAYASWDEAYDKYLNAIAPYTLDFEYGNQERSFSTPAPKLTKLATRGSTLTLTWETVPGADGYCVYRKTSGTGWEPVAVVDADSQKFRDENCKVGEKYAYTVASFQKKGKEIHWGNYDFSGLSATAL